MRGTSGGREGGRERSIFVPFSTKQIRVEFWKEFNSYEAEFKWTTSTKEMVGDTTVVDFDQQWVLCVKPVETGLNNRVAKNE